MPKMPSKKRKVLDELKDLEQKRLDTVERLHFHLVAPKEFEVDQRDLDYLENLRAAWSIINENPVKYKQIKLISEALMVTERHARNIINDAELLFAPIYKSNEEVDKAFLTEFYMRLARKAEAGGYYDTAKACGDSIAKMKGYFDKELPIRPEDLNIPTINITTNPKALNDDIDEAEVIEEEK